MFVKTLRREARLSQQGLADAARLSLRTIQRIEAGHRVSYASMRALAKALSVDVDQLERELFAADKVGEYREKPLWARLLVGRGGLSADRRELLNAEIILAALGAGLGALWAANSVWALVYDPEGQILPASLTMFLFAYSVSVFIRVGDRYSWAGTIDQNKDRHQVDGNHSEGNSDVSASR